MVCVVPTEVERTAQTRDIPEALITFPWEADIGTGVQDVPIVIVYNGKDHYCASKLLQETFQDGVDMFIYHCNEAKLVASQLMDCAEDKDVKDIFSKGGEIVKNAAYAGLKLFKYSSNSDVALQNPPKKIRLERTRQIKSTITNLHCACGALKESIEQLNDHIQRRHSEGSWRCAYEECKQLCSSQKALKRHLRQQHFNEFLHYCLYCNFGRDEVHLVLNHMSEKHSATKEFACTNENCTKLFSSQQHLSRHLQLCGIAEKLFFCKYCNKGYRKKDTCRNHEKHNHADEELSQETPEAEAEAEADPGDLIAPPPPLPVDPQLEGVTPEVDDTDL